MARPLRIEFPGALYHVTARGNAREEIFLDEADRRLFLEVLARVVSRFGFVVYAYCLMGNHYHLLVETPRANLSLGMRQLNGVYTQAFNRRHGRVGHVLQGRYKAILVEKEGHLLEAARYVVLNPVRAKLCERADEWAWSSYQATAGAISSPLFLAGEEVVALFGSSQARAQERYRAFVAEGLGETPFAELRGQIYLGSDEFVTRHATQSERLEEVPRPQWQPLRPALAEIVAMEGERAILVANRRYGYRLREIADYLDCHLSTVSRRLARLEAANNA